MPENNEQNEQIAQVHRLVTDKDLDQMLGAWKSPNASADLLNRITSSAEETPQRSSMSPVVMPLMQAAAVLVIALGLGIWAGLDAQSGASVNTASSISDQIASGDMPL
jgi:hypothetical protein